MKKETAIKAVKWIVGLGLGALAVYNIYVFWPTNKKNVDTTGMGMYQITMPFSYQSVVGNIYDALNKFNFADVDQGVIKDNAGNPISIMLTIMAKPEDAQQIQTQLTAILPEAKFKEIKTNQKSINK